MVHILGKLIAVLLLTALITGEASARIYKTIDSNGNPVFTDVPPNDGSQPLELNPGNQFSRPTQPSSTAQIGDQDPREEDLEEDFSLVPYEHLRILSPTNDEAVRANAGDLTVQFYLYPDLQVERGHQVELLLDGKIYATSKGGSISLLNVDRGTHQLQIQVVDGNGTALMDSSSINFHLLRRAIQNRRSNSGQHSRNG
ncbi:MAG: DUF4124 domain-containing protein [Gammaproteobacteria bacterium]|nr:DUF4124 domain-containing protein [Gammaproteobacteria bacterium]